MIDARLRRFIEIVAAERTRSHPELFDECVQEGMIAAWRAMEKSPGKEAVYYRVAAKNGVMAPLRGRSPFGHQAMRGREDAHGHAGSLWAASEDGDEHLVVDPEDERSRAALGAVEVADAVRDVVRTLPPLDREIVIRRYWDDESFADIARLVDRPAGTLSRRWTQIIRPALREALDEVA